MSDQDMTPETDQPDDMHPVSRMLFGWVEAKNTGRYIFWGIAALSAILLIIDLFVHRHSYNGVESLLGLYGWYGFLAFSLVVLAGWPLGKLLRRPENYYGDEDPADEDGEER